MTSKLYRRRKRLDSFFSWSMAAAAWLLWVCVVCLLIAGLAGWSWHQHGCEPEALALKASLAYFKVAGVVALVALGFVVAARFFERAWDKTFGEKTWSDIW